MKAELDAAGIPEDTVDELLNSRYDYEQAVPIMVDWLEHLDERVPADQNRDGWRAGLLRNLITKYARGNRRAFDAVIRLFYLDPPMSYAESEAATLALLAIATPAQFAQMTALIDHLRGVTWRWHVVSWLAKVKTPDAIALTTQLLDDLDPAVRYQAVKAIARQKPRGLGARITALLDDPDPDVREEAAKTLTKLPDRDVGTDMTANQRPLS